MTPNNPELPENPGGDTAVTPTAVEPAASTWGFFDILLFVFLLIPCIILALLLTNLIGRFTPLHKPVQQLMLAQLVLYALIFASLYALLQWRYALPFWRSLGWRPLSFGAAVVSLLGGPVLAAVIGYLGFVLRMPEIQLPFQQMLTDRTTVLLTGLFVVVLGPLCEELVFRGFILPVFIRNLGVAAGIVLTGLLFGIAHGQEYDWSWRHIALITMAGSIFGWVKYKTKSTASAAFMHSTFNLAQFAAFLTQSHTL